MHVQHSARTILHVLATCILILVPAVPAQAAPVDVPEAATTDCYDQTHYCVSDPDFQSYFHTHGEVNVFGYPVSGVFPLLGCPIQIFQRLIMQKCQGSPVSLLNLLDPELFPYTRVNQSVFPGPDEDLKRQTPQVGTPEYGRILNFIRDNTPDTFNGEPVRFWQTFQSLGGLDILGTPISKPAVDPGNPSFIYMRFQRVILHYRRGIGTEPLLLADYLKQIILGTLAPNLPADLADQARSSKLYNQYCRGGPRSLCRLNDLGAGSDLTFAFSAPPIMISQDDLAALGPTLRANGLDVGSINTARTTTFVLPGQNAITTQVAPVTRAPTATSADLTRSNSDVPIGVILGTRSMPLHDAAVNALAQGIYLVKVKAGKMVFVGTNGREIATGLQADIRQLKIPRRLPQTIVSYKDVCFSWNQTQVCTQPSPRMALTGQERGNVDAMASAGRDAIKSRGWLPNADLNTGAWVTEAAGASAVDQRSANVLAAPATSITSQPIPGAANGKLVGLLQAMQQVDVPGQPSVPPGTYAVVDMGGGIARLVSTSSEATLDLPARQGEVRGFAPGEENLTLIVDLWMVAFCLFDQTDVCDG